MMENEIELRPTMRVYRALVMLTTTNLQTAQGVDEYLTAAEVMLPEMTRAQLEEMDIGALAELLRERIKQITTLFAQRAEVFLAISQADDLVNHVPD